MKKYTPRNVVALGNWYMIDMVDLLRLESVALGEAFLCVLWGVVGVFLMIRLWQSRVEIPGRGYCSFWGFAYS